MRRSSPPLTSVELPVDINNLKLDEAASKDQRNIMKKLRNTLINDKQIVHITIKEFMDYFQ